MCDLNFTGNYHRQVLFLATATSSVTFRVAKPNCVSADARQEHLCSDFQKTGADLFFRWSRKRTRKRESISQMKPFCTSKSHVRMNRCMNLNRFFLLLTQFLAYCLLLAHSFQLICLPFFRLFSWSGHNGNTINNIRESSIVFKST